MKGLLNFSLLSLTSKIHVTDIISISEFNKLIAPNSLLNTVYHFCTDINIA